MSLPVTYDFAPYHGDTWARTFQISRGGVPIDLTGSTAAAWARSELGAIVHLDVSTNGNGEVTIRPPAEGLTPGPWQYDVEVTDEAGGVTTYVCGEMTVRRDVTNA